MDIQTYKAVQAERKGYRQRSTDADNGRETVSTMTMIETDRQNERKAERQAD